MNFLGYGFSVKLEPHRILKPTTGTEAFMPSTSSGIFGFATTQPPEDSPMFQMPPVAMGPFH